MNDRQYIEAIHAGHLIYWDMLGKLQGMENHNEGGLRWLSGGIFYNYYTTNTDVMDVVRRMKSGEIPNNLTFHTSDLTSDPTEIFRAAGMFKDGFGTLGMAHLLMDTTLPEPDKRLSISRVFEITSLKAAGAILNTVFDYRLFTLTHFQEMLQNDGQYFYLAEYDGLPVGACMAQHGDDFVNISWVGTLNGYRKLGIAGYLIQEAEREGVNRGKAVGVLHALANAVGAYKRIGYRGYCKTVQMEFITEASEAVDFEHSI